jgi:hypothetical protein
VSSFHLYDIQRKSGLFVRKFGSNGAIDLQENNPDADDVAGDYVFPSDSGETMYISSSSALDTMPIRIQGLDADFKEKEQTITLQGQTRLTLDGTWSRINRAFNDDTNDIAGKKV